MRRSLIGLIVGTMAGGLLLAAACAPAATPSTQQDTSRQPGTGETKTDQKPSGTTDTKPAEQAAKASLSGIPLEPDAKFGGILKLSYSQEGPTFSLWEEAGGVAFEAGQPLLNSIIRSRTWGTNEDFKAQKYFELAPDLAKSWEQSKDGLQWTFKFRDGVKWSDGVPFTCADAKWSLDAIRTGEGLKRSPRAVQFLAVKDIQCPDALTMVINMKNPKPGFLEVVGMPYHVVLPKHKYENNSDEMRTKPLIGTGPFTLKEWIPQERYVFERKADYWDEPLPYLNGIDDIFLANSAEAPALRTGRIDMAGYFGFYAGAAETIQRECSVCQMFDKAPESGGKFLMINHQRPPWNQPKMKEALALAIDKQKFVDVILRGWGVPPTGGGLYPGSYWAMPKERLAQIPGFDFDNPAKNKERATAILKELGYAPGQLELTLEMGVYNEEDIPSIVEDLTEVGFKVNAKKNEVGRTYAMFSAGDFDIATHHFWIAGFDPDVYLYEHYYTGSDRNYNRYSNPKYDELVDKQSQTVDQDARRKLVWDAVELALREQAKIPYSQTSYMPAWNKRLRGLMPAINYFSYGPANRHDHTWLSDAK